MPTTRITEMGVTFYKAGGHKHDGITSSLIDTSKYSIFDFDLSLSTGGADTTRESTRQANRNRFNQYVGNFITTQVLAPAGIVLPADSVRGVNIGANEITANNIRANTITSDLLITDFAVVNSTIRSNNFTYDGNTGIGTGWAIYGNGTSIFVDGIFSGEIDVGGFDNTSFHVDTGGNVWSGSPSYATAPFRVASTGDTVLANGRLIANTTGNINITGNLTVDSPYVKFISGNSLSTGMSVDGWIVSTSVVQGDTVNAIGQLSGGSDFTIFRNEYGPILRLEGAGFFGNVGVTKLKLTRYSIASGAPSAYTNQMIQLWNVPEEADSQGVAGIGFLVGQSNIGGAVLRAFPKGSGGSPAWYNNNGTISSGVITAQEGLDVGNLVGNGYAPIGAFGFIVRSSAILKDNIEYMPPESRDISVERIKNLKPARWSDKSGLTEGNLSEKFMDINERWIAKGRRALSPRLSDYEFKKHDCEKSNCAGSGEIKCPSAELYHKRYGFIAEDVATAFPKAVQLDPYGAPSGIDYAVITYGLVETTQHLLDKIDELESKIAELSAQ